MPRQPRDASPDSDSNSGSSILSGNENQSISVTVPVHSSMQRLSMTGNINQAYGSNGQLTKNHEPSANKASFYRPGEQPTADLLFANEKPSTDYNFNDGKISPSSVSSVEEYERRKSHQKNYALKSNERSNIKQVNSVRKYITTTDDNYEEDEEGFRKRRNFCLCCPC